MAEIAPAANLMVDGSWSGPTLGGTRWTHTTGVTFTYGAPPIGIDYPGAGSGFGPSTAHFILRAGDAITMNFPTHVIPQTYFFHDLDNGGSGGPGGTSNQETYMMVGGAGTPVTFSNPQGTNYQDNLSAGYGTSNPQAPRNVQLASARALDAGRNMVISHEGGGIRFTVDVEYFTIPIPEPSTGLLSLLGLSVVAMRRRRR